MKSSTRVRILTDQDSEIGQRFMDVKRLGPCTGVRLDGLLVFLDLLLEKTILASYFSGVTLHESKTADVFFCGSSGF